MDLGEPSLPRPSRLSRSISTPHPTGSTSRVGSGNPIHARSPPIQIPRRGGYGSEQQKWSLFGQLMSPDQPGVLKRSMSSQATGSLTNPTVIIPENRVDEYPDIPDVHHSPTAMDPPELLTPRIKVKQRAYFEPDQSDESDSGYLTDGTDSEEEEKIPPPPTTFRSHITVPAMPQIPLLYRNILKCAIAYLIASLFTFNPTLSLLIHDLTPWKGDGERVPSPSAHMVATIAVYFNPAKTLGGMVEADIFCVIGLCYSSAICLISIILFSGVQALEDRHSYVLVRLAHLGVLIWIGLALSLVAFMKVWMNRPSFNTACSMTLIILFVVLIREPTPTKLANTCIIVILGSIISNLVNRLIWPTSATQNLQSTMIKSLDSFKVLLDILTQSFLLGGEFQSTQGRAVSLEKLQKAVDSHQSSFVSLKKNLDEAKSEWLVTGGGGTPTSPDISGSNSGDFTPRNASRRHPSHIIEEENSIWDRFIARKKDLEQRSSRKAYEDAVDSLNRLAQHLNGLRSGNRLFTRWFESREDSDNDSASGDALSELLDELGPPLTALSYTCTNSLKVLKEAFVQSHTSPKDKHQNLARGFSSGSGGAPNGSSGMDGRTNSRDNSIFEDLITEISKTLTRFDSTSNHALLRQYRRNENIKAHEDQSGTGEEMFVVYFFIFTLQEFAREMVSLVDAVERIHINEQMRLSQGSIFRRLFIHFPRDRFINGPKNLWRLIRGNQDNKRIDMREVARGLRRSVSQRVTTLKVRRTKGAQPTPFFPKVRSHAPNTIATPYNDLDTIGRIKAKLWVFSETLHSRNTKHAFKVGTCTAILAAPAFSEATRAWYLAWYGQWALISYFVVISPTIGATNFLSLHRILGTITGAAVAAGIFTLFPDQPFILAIFGFLFSLPCFYIIVAKPQYVTTGRFVLLTYNLTCLYCYNLREADLTPTFIATRRGLAVVAGVVWAGLVSRVWWPAEARRELAKSLSEFCLNLGWLYTRLVASNSYAPEYTEESFPTDDGTDPEPTDRTPLIRKPVTAVKHSKTTNSIEEFMAMELHLQLKLIELQGLLSQTAHEPRLKGPFPVAVYRGILASLQTILDRLHSMRCVTTKEEWYTSVRQGVIIPVNKERRELVGNIILSFSTLSSSFRTKAPLPPYLPPAEECRLALVQAIQKLNLIRSTDIVGSRQLLFYAYVLTMKGVTVELEQLGKTLQSIFGVIGEGADRFEELFISESGHRISRGE